MDKIKSSNENVKGLIDIKIKCWIESVNHLKQWKKQFKRGRYYLMALAPTVFL
ncbi:hypothetical protein RirG_099830 [Rhizophagus irregularis DAOM 197198w]|uniref:Uncharacterized protein n=1 Tax=Rhizophagus irregularis (strain DAOM 197198w) TaxID=1432141 RepID=A0A015KN70_RHIIW|nr:hypothetical protein RirG_099830 [Rhizophagus irregularis DAOM 197198w]